MFEINIDHVIEECSQLEKQHNEYMQYISELESAIWVLDSMMPNQDIASMLCIQKNKMERQREMIRQMIQALDQSVIYYRNCEKRICDDGEQTAVRFSVEDVCVTDLSGLQGILDNMIY